jgi:hypothetical protein
MGKQGLVTDDWQHCAMSCKMAKLCGALLAELAGIMKETGPKQIVEIFKDFDPSIRDMMTDLIANQQCIPWESTLGVFPRIVGTLCRESCFECCDRKVGRT